MEKGQIRSEESLGVTGTPITEADLVRFLPESMLASSKSDTSDEKRLELELRRSIVPTNEERRSQLQQRIVSNAQTESPHRYYFVREPGL